jgi:hypothetical protein
MPAHPLRTLERVDLAIAAKAQVQRLQRQQHRAKVGAGLLGSLGHQGHAPMVAGEDLQNQAGLAPVVAVQHVGRLFGDALGGHGSAS